MRFSVTQIRIAILLLNLVLTLVVGAQSLYAVFHQPTSIAVKPPDPKAFGDDHAGTVRGDVNVVALVPGIASGFQQKAEIVPPPPSTDDKDKKPKDPEIVKDGELPPGPLNEAWELVHTIVYLEDPQSSRATLQRKDPGGAISLVGRKVGSKVGKVLRSPPPPGARVVRPNVQGAPPILGEKKTLRILDTWKDEDLKIDIRVRDITRDDLVYEDHNQPGRTFGLRRKASQIYPVGENGVELKKAPEEETADGKDDKETHFLPTPPDREKTFETWGRDQPSGKKGVAAAKGASPATPALTPAGGAQRPLSQEEQLKQAQTTLKNLETSEKFRKVPKAERDKLQKLLGGGPKK